MKTKGWAQVFRFTFIQTVKTKSFIISTIVISLILALIVVGINFIPMMTMGDNVSEIFSGDTSEYQIKTVYYLDESGIEPKADFSSLSDKGVAFESITADEYQQKLAEIKGSDIPATVLYIGSPDDYGQYYMLMSRPENGDIVSGSECESLLSEVTGIFNKYKLMAMGVSESDLANAQTSVFSEVAVAGEKPISMIESVVNTLVPMLSSLVLFMFIFCYGQMVAQAIATEKTSRVMELLLTSIKPLAVIIGKVLAIGCVSLAQMLIMGTVTGTAFAVSAPFGIIGKLTSEAAGGIAEASSVMDGVSNALANVNIGSVLLIIVIFILGFLFYALIAGLIGASISRIEDLQTAMQPMAIIGVLGFYLAYFPTMSNMSTSGDNAGIFTILSHYLPISSPFSLPSAIILGEMDAGEVAVSIGVLAVFVVLMAMLVAKVYESIILHSGDRIKFSQMLKMAKTK